MFKKKNTTNASIELNDYVIRVIINEGSLETAKLLEMPLPVGVVEEGIIVDDMTLYETIKPHAHKLGKKRHIRFFAPDTSVLMKQFDVPENTEDLRGYVEMELGKSIHLPFEDPLLDIYDPNLEDGKAVMFAAPPEEIQKVINLSHDLHFTPEAADIRALCNLRLLDHLQLLKKEKTYFISDWSLNELSICIYSNGHVEFLRYQPIDTDLTNWKSDTNEQGITSFKYEGDMNDYQMLISDQVLELDRMMNFFKFSLHKGEKSIDEIVVLGDNPLLDQVTHLLSENFSMPIHTITDAIIQKRFPNMRAQHATLIGLALKEVNV